MNDDVGQETEEASHVAPWREAGDAVGSLREKWRRSIVNDIDGAAAMTRVGVIRKDVTVSRSVTM
jgi:hypothetical protein